MSRLKTYSNYNPVHYDYIDKLPDGWYIKKLKFICNLETGNSIANKDNYIVSNNSRPYISSKDINLDDSVINYDNGIYIPLKDKNFKIAFPDSILLCIEGGSAGKKIGFTKSTVSFVNKLCAIKSIINKLNTKYIFYYMKSKFFKGLFFSQLSGMIGGVSLKGLSNIKIPLPPLETQNTIVAYLDYKTQQIQRFINKKQRLIELLEEKKKVIIINECTNTFESRDKKIKFVVKICNGQDQKNIEKINGKYPIFGSGGKIGTTDCFLHDKTSVLLGRKGTINKPIFVSEPFWSIDTAFYTIINEKKILPKYFYYVCTFLPYEEFIYGSAIPSMTQGILNNIKIPVPSLEIQLQILQKIKERHKFLDIAIFKINQEIKKAKEYQESLITHIVTGQLKTLNLIKTAVREHYAV
jgi:type I restriction enzyme S subunit